MLPLYSNGRLPESALAQLDSGTTGRGRHVLPHTTAARWYGLRRDVYAETGVMLYITPGMNGYRDWDEQGIGRANACASGNCNAAAAQGWSSHGGTWSNGTFTGGRWVDAAAIDVGNYWAVPWDTFKRIAEHWGFLVGAITRAIAGIEEPWHIIDLSPYADMPHGVSLTRGADGVWRLVDAAPARTAPPLEEDQMEAIRINGEHLVAIGVGTFRHFIGTDPFEKIKNILRIQDDWQDIGFGELPALLRTYGCDLNIWDVRGGAFVVLDPLDGSVKSGNVWTATNAARAAIARIPQPSIDPTPIVEAARSGAYAGAVSAAQQKG